MFLFCQKNHKNVSKLWLFDRFSKRGKPLLPAVDLSFMLPSRTHQRVRSGLPAGFSLLHSARHQLAPGWTVGQLLDQSGVSDGGVILHRPAGQPQGAPTVTLLILLSSSGFEKHIMWLWSSGPIKISKHRYKYMFYICVCVYMYKKVENFVVIYPRQMLI